MGVPRTERTTVVRSRTGCGRPVTERESERKQEVPTLQEGALLAIGLSCPNRSAGQGENLRLEVWTRSAHQAPIRESNSWVTRTSNEHGIILAYMANLRNCSHRRHLRSPGCSPWPGTTRSRRDQRRAAFRW